MFLQMFNLKNESVPLPPASSSSPASASKSPAKRTKDPPEKLKRWPKRGRAVMVLAKCPTIAISSPAGQQLSKLSKTAMSAEYLSERLDRTERFCHAPCLGRVATTSSRPKFMDRRKPTSTNISSSFRRPPGYFYHQYTFPRRQFSKRRRDEAFLHLNSRELSQCKPVSINIKKMSLTNFSTIENSTYCASGRSKRSSTEGSTKHKETADSRRRSKPNATKRRNQRVNTKTDTKNAEDVIDLCSSDDEQVAKRPGRADSTRSSSQNARSNIHFSTNGLPSLSPLEQISFYPLGSEPGGSSSSCYFGSQPGSQPSPNQQPSVLIISHLTQTSMTLDNHKKTYRFQNQENNFQLFANGSSSTGADTSSCEIASLPTSVTLTSANHQHHNNNKLLPEVVLERISHGVLQPPNQQQLCIDLT